MKRLWTAIKAGYVRLLEPLAAFLVRHDVHPNLITTLGTVCSIIGGCIYGSGHIRTGGWFLGVTALFDVLDGTVARRTGRTSAFGAFYDSTLDRIADGAVMSGLAFFYATSKQHGNVPMIAVCLVGLLGGFLVSYTRARAEALGVDAKVGFMQRPERVVLLSAPQAFFGLALDGWVLAAIIVSLTVTSWATAIQRIVAVYRATVNSSNASRSSSTPITSSTPSSDAVKPIPASPVSAEPPKAAKAVNV
jgi:CDP-diacylglycerol--glycerol-3-phosphate 3-phosphatidyltransferase